MQTPDAPEPDAEYFISQVQKRSGGRIQIVEGTGYTSSNPVNEARLVRALRSGKVEMAYIPSRAWERAGSVSAFRALQAPFLVTNYRVLHEVTNGPIGRSMLASLGSIGIVGLGLVPDELRRLLERKPLTAPGLGGARIRVVASPTSVLALRSLGATPVTSFTSSQVGPALEQGQLDGAELSTNAILNNSDIASAHYIPANVALFAKAQTIAIRRSVFERLSAGDRQILQAAARATVAHADPAGQEQQEVAQQLCNQGLKLVQETAADLAGLRKLALAAYPVLERDPTTRREITAIERLERQSAGTTPLPICPGKKSGGPSGPKTSAFEGTYVVTASLSEVTKASGSPGNNWGSFRLVLGDGRFGMSDRRPGNPTEGGVTCRFSSSFCSSGSTVGTYVINGDRIIFTAHHGRGDTPMGAPGDPPIICRWSLYRNSLTFQQLPAPAQAKASRRGLDPVGPPLLYVRPWQKSSAQPSAPRRPAGGFPTGTFETKITPADVQGVGGPTWWAHWETRTFRNGMVCGVWFHPRRADQPSGCSRYRVSGNTLYTLASNGIRDSFRWSYYRGRLTLKPLKAPDLDELGILIFTAHSWRKIK
jgi:C4-dicarboxylate-binding protein DctP